LGTPKKFTPATEAEAVQRYKAGESLREIAAAFGVTKPAVRYRLIKLGVQMRPGGRHEQPRTEPPPPLVAAELVRRYQSGETPDSLTAAFPGVTRRSLLLALEAAGVAPRSQAEAQSLRQASTPAADRRRATRAAREASLVSRRGRSTRPGPAEDPEL
jgi:uncharacterized protein (DUF433 family)